MVVVMSAAEAGVPRLFIAMTFCIDGEKGPDMPIEVRNLPGEIKLLVPKAYMKGCNR